MQQLSGRYKIFQMKPAITPGKILLEDYLIPMGISQNALTLLISPEALTTI